MVQTPETEQTRPLPAAAGKGWVAAPPGRRIAPTWQPVRASPASRLQPPARG